MKAIFYFLTFCACLADSIIPSTRQAGGGAGWQYAGIPGGIPFVLLQYTNLSGLIGIADATAGIQQAIDNCPSNQFIYMPSGTYYVSNKVTPVLLNKDGVVIRGDGPRRTIWVNSTTNLGSTWLFINNTAHEYDFSGSTKYALSGAYVAGNSNIITGSANTFAVGDFIYFDQQTNTIGTNFTPFLGVINQRGSPDSAGECLGQCGSRAGRPYGQFTRVAAVADTTHFTCEPPLMGWYATSNSPQVMKAVGLVQKCGIESMSFTNRYTGAATGGAEQSYTIFGLGMYRCWFTNLEMSVSIKRHLFLENNFETQIQQNFFQLGRPPDWGDGYGPDSAYGIFMGWGSSSYLICDNIGHHIHFCFAHEGPSSGGVIYGNFVTNVMFDTHTTIQPAGGYHASHPHGHLWEQNIFHSGKIMFDRIWGSGSDSTIFRNRVAMWTTIGGTNVDQFSEEIDFWAYQHNHNIVGNVLGTTNWNKWILYPDGHDPYEGGGSIPIYRFGFYDAADSSYSRSDSQVTNSMIRKNNYVFVANGSGGYTNGVPSDESIGSTNMVNSYFYTTRPSWWGPSSNWPSIGPELPFVDSKIFLPAKSRFFGDTNYLNALPVGAIAIAGPGKARSGQGVQ